MKPLITIPISQPYYFTTSKMTNKYIISFKISQKYKDWYAFKGNLKDFFPLLFEAENNRPAKLAFYSSILLNINIINMRIS